MFIISFFSEVKRIFKCNDIVIKERLNTVEASFFVTKEDFPFIDQFVYIFSITPSRDLVAFSLINDSGDIVQITKDNIENADFSLLIDNLVSLEEISINIQIDKTYPDEKFSIYSFNSFVNDLLQHSTIEIMEWFSKLLQNKNSLFFEIFDGDISFSTKTIAFESNVTATFTPNIDRQKKLNICKENSCFYNMHCFEIIPDDFIIEGVVRGGDCLKPLFGKISTILSLVYVGSSASIYDEAINLQVNGQRTISYAINLKDIQESEKWITIYNWIFTDGNPTDKMIIAHNVISLYCRYGDLLHIDTTMFDAIKTNYNLYLHNNVNKYLDMKKEIGKFIQNIVSQVSDYALSLLEKFKANLIAIFGFLFTVVLSRIGTTQKWGDIFTKHTIYMVEIFLIGSVIYMLICLYETKYKLKKVKIGYEELKNNYKDVLSDLEINEAFQNDRLMTGTEKSAKKGMKRWSIIWGGLFVIAISIIEIFTSYHGLIVWLLRKIF